MLEPWEKVSLRESSSSYFLPDHVCYNFLSVLMLGLFFSLVITGLFKYLPHHLNVMCRRAMYYLFGQEGDPRQWFGIGKGVENGVRELLKESQLLGSPIEN